MAQLTPRGDGSYIFKPRPVESDLDAWLSVKDAARRLGVSLTCLYGLLDENEPCLVSRRPARWKILVSLKSVEAYRKATVNPAFWTKAVLRNTHIANTRAALAALAKEN